MRSTDEPYTVLEPGDPHPLGWKVPPIDDLRSALEYLKTMPGQFIETDREVDPNAELAGVYRYVGAGGTVMRPTRIGPAMMFNTVKGYPGARVLVGLLASRERVSHLLGAPARQLGIQMAKARLTVTPPVNVERELALCQEVVHKADEPGFDLRHLLPAPTNTPQDAGPYFCMGLVLGSDPDDRGNVDVTIHRLCVQGPDELSIFFAPGRHIDAFRQKAEAQGKPLAVSVNMGLDPAIHIGAEFEAPTTPFGFDELCVAGGLRGSRSSWSSASRWRRKRSHGPRSLSRARSCRTSAWRKTRTRTPARRCPSSRAIPETPNPSLPVIKVKAVTTRKNPILQTLVGPGEEHVSLAGIPTEASIYNARQDALAGLLKNVYAHSSGGGKFLAVLQLAKRNAGDDGNARRR